MSSKTKSLPYATATSGNRAREETLRILRRLGCERLGFMDDDAAHEVVLYFEHRGQKVRIPASARGWAARWLSEHPQTYRSRKTEHEYKQEALAQGHLAVSSMLRDMIKGGVTRIETGMFSFEQEFAPFMLTADGQPLLERMKEALPAPEGDKVVALPSKALGP